MIIYITHGCPESECTSFAKYLGASLKGKNGITLKPSCFDPSHIEQSANEIIV